MKAVIQRVRNAYVETENRRVSIEKGILTLLAIEPEDTENDSIFLLDLILNLRIFEDENEKMNFSLLDIKGEHLVVSQFTLAADFKKGKRPSFTKAANPNFAKILVHGFVELSKKQIRTETGVFGAHMNVGLLNDGPATFILDSKSNRTS